MTTNLYARLQAATTPTASTTETIEAVTGIVTAELAAKEDRLLLAETSLTRARQLHRPTQHETTGGPWCHECTPHTPWPCPTTQALNNITPPQHPPTPRRKPTTPPTTGPTTTTKALTAGLTWIHTTVQPRTALINHNGLPLRTTTNRTLRFVPTPTGKALIIVNVTRLTWKHNGEQLTPTDQIGPTELDDLTTQLADLGSKVTSTWNGHPTTTGTLALHRAPHPTLINATKRYQAGCPTHPIQGARCACGWYQRGRAQIIHPTP